MMNLKKQQNTLQRIYKIFDCGRYVYNTKKTLTAGTVSATKNRSNLYLFLFAQIICV